MCRIAPTRQASYTKPTQHNFTQYSGCGHFGEHPHERYTPCDTAYFSINSKRGASFPPTTPPRDIVFFSKPPNHSKTSKSRRFFGLRRPTTTASTSSRRTLSAPVSVGSNHGSTMSGTASQFPDHEILPVVKACPNMVVKTMVSSNAGWVCEECAKWIEHMRHMIAGYDSKRGVRGNAAFKEFLEDRRECRAIEKDLNLGASKRASGDETQKDSGDELNAMRPLV